MGANQDHLSEIEVVAQRTLLIVDDGMPLDFTLRHGEIVAKDHRRVGILGRPNHSQHSAVAHFDNPRFQVEKHKIARRFFCDFQQFLRRWQSVGLQRNIVDFLHYF